MTVAVGTASIYHTRLPHQRKLERAARMLDLSREAKVRLTDCDIGYCRFCMTCFKDTELLMDRRHRVVSCCRCLAPMLPFADGGLCVDEPEHVDDRLQGHGQRPGPYVFDGVVAGVVIGRKSGVIHEDHAHG